MRAVLVTRTAPGAQRTLDRLARLGFNPIPAVTAEIRPRPVEWPDEVAALALTSPNGAVRAGELAPDKTLPVFAVGDATAAAARKAGFSDVASASGDGAALAVLIAESRSSGPVLHLRGEDQAFDVVAGLIEQGLQAQAAIAYAAEPVDQLPAAALDAMRPGAVVLIHSAKGASRFIELVRQASRQDELTRLRAVAISQEAAAPLLDQRFARIDIAAVPTEDALMQALCAAR